MRIFFASIFFFFPAVGAGAQEIGSVPLRLEYDVISMQGLDVNEKSEELRLIKPLPDGGYLDFNCTSALAEECYTLHLKGLANAAAWGNLPPSSTPEAALKTLLPIETQDVSGAPLFPLVDGAVRTWVELWDGDGFQAKYQMQLTTRCCEANPELGLAMSSTLWAIDFTYDNPGDVGHPHGGQITYLYDPKLHVVVSEKSFSRWEGSPARYTFKVLTGFSQP